jgi:hypothetical protein
MPLRACWKRARARCWLNAWPCLGDMPVSKAEQQVKASEFWSDYIKRMVNTKTQANKAKDRS